MRNVIELNYSRDIDYNKQRDNKIYSIETCGPTSMAMAIIQAGYINWIKKDEDPADTITKHLTTSEAYDRMYKILGTKNTNWKPFNIHAVLTWGINDLLNENISTFRTNWDIRQIIFNLIKKGGIVLSGDFTLKDGRELGHMVSFAGIGTKQKDIEKVNHFNEIEMDKIEYFIIDDPYGNYLTDYREHNGNNIIFEPNLFFEIFRPKGRNLCWGHLIKPKN